jgi:hypothetical protein
LKQETQQKIMSAVRQTRADLFAWVRRMGLSEARVSAIFSDAMKENGLLARLIFGITGNIISMDVERIVQAEQVGHPLESIDTGELGSQLLNEPEPTAEELEQTLRTLKSVLPNLRRKLLGSSKLGPRYKAGGRRKELADPEIRQNIRDTIKGKRDSGKRLKDLFQQLAKQYRVSPGTIKRIWIEKVPGSEGKESSKLEGDDDNLDTVSL